MRIRSVLVFGMPAFAVGIAVSFWRAARVDESPLDPMIAEDITESVESTPTTSATLDSASSIAAEMDAIERTSMATDEPVRPTLAGTVRDPDSGVPITGIDVVFASIAPHPELRTTTTGDGSFRFEIDPATLDPHVPSRGSCEVRADRDGWVSNVTTISPDELIQGSQVTLYSAPEGIVTLRLREAADGSPAVASVAFLGTVATSEADGRASCKLAAGGALRTRPYVIEDDAAMARGEHRLVGLIHGRPADLVLRLTDDRRYTYKLAPLTRCGENRSVEIDAPRPESRIRGKLSRSGEAYGGVVVWRGPTLGGSSRAGPDGLFEIVGVEPGLVTLFARDGNTTRTIEALVDVPGDRTIDKDLDIRVSPVLRGIVRGVNGRKLRVTATARYGIDPVWFEAEPARRRKPLPIPTPDASADVFADGSFEIRVRDSGTDYVIEIESRAPREFGPDRVGYAVALPGDTGIVLDAERGRR